MYFLYYLMFYQKYFEIHFIPEERDFIVYINVCDSNISGDDDCVESKPLLFMFYCMKKYQTVVLK